MRGANATVGDERVTYTAFKGVTVYTRSGSRFVRVAWFSNRWGLSAYAEGIGGDEGANILEAMSLAMARAVDRSLARRTQSTGSEPRP